LDFGAIGKGFVVDRIGEAMQAIGLHRFLVNASGNMRCGSPPTDAAVDSDRAGWPISIGLVGHPDRELKQLRLSRCGIATSGDQYQRFRDGSPSEGRKPTSHIIDPAVQRGLEQSNMATVIARSASDADALATACCVHLQRGSINNWLARVEAELASIEFVLQTQRDNSVALTTVSCDW
jgi:thiamine biosynthesis lipoprotein